METPWRIKREKETCKEPYEHNIEDLYLLFYKRYRYWQLLHYKIVDGGL